MRLHSELTINGKCYRAGDEVSWTSVYPFFLLHMLIFGGSGFFMAYMEDGPAVAFLYAHGGLAILVYTVFYFAIFGREEVKWMFMNAALGVFGIYAELDWLLSFFGRTLGSYPLYVHVIPFLYYVLYTFLLRQAVLDWTDARKDANKRRQVERNYIGASVLIYSAMHLF